MVARLLCKDTLLNRLNTFTHCAFVLQNTNVFGNSFAEEHPLILKAIPPKSCYNHVSDSSKYEHKECVGNLTIIEDFFLVVI